MKRSLLWLLLVFAVGVPGLLLLQFAITDARDFGDPWIKLAIPFLAACAICMVLCGRSLGRRAALLGGALALVLAFSSFWRVHSAIAARTEQREAADAIADLGRLCAARSPKDLAPTPLPTSRALLVYEVDKDEHARIAIDRAYDAVQATRAADATLAACIRYTRSKVETCNYDGGAFADRFRLTARVTLVDTKSGTPIATTKLAGEVPRACSAQESFTDWGAGVSHYKAIEGPAPSAEQIADALRPFVAGAR
ncbi:MAG: hypothetical protein ACKV2T_25615 [Kofleriaceae bacterium]